MLSFSTGLPRTPALPLPDPNRFLNPHSYSGSPIPIHSHPLPPKQMPCRLTLSPFQVQKKTTKAKRPLQRNLREKSSQSPPSCSRTRKVAIRPMIFICYHKGTKECSENGDSGIKEHWKMQPSQVTFCAASKCRAWARNLELATASYEAAVENWWNT